MQSLLDIAGLLFRYPTRDPGDREWLLNIPQVSLPPAMGVSLMGENMAGKTSLVQLLTGTSPHVPSDCVGGKISLNGCDFHLPVNSLAIRQAGVAVVQQADPMFKSLSIWDNIRLGCPSRQNYSKRKTFVYRKLKEILKNISPDSNREIEPSDSLSVLSGGPRAIIRMVRATCWGYKLLLLDEPTVNLSSENTERFFQILNDFWEDGATIILVSFLDSDHSRFRAQVKNNGFEYRVLSIKGGQIQ